MGGRPSLILATSNGTGMGHLARQLAVAMAAAPEARVTLLSLSVALPTAVTEEIPGEYCPSPDRDWIPEVAYPHYLAGRIEALVREVSAEVVVFDGVAPYRGVTLAKKRLPETAFVWFRRGMWQPRVNDGQLWKSNLFDAVFEPGDLAKDADRGPTASLDDALRMSPVSLVEVVDRPDRSDAAAMLAIDPERPTLLLTLGTGRLGDVTSTGSTILRTALGSDSWQICVATSAVASSSIPTDPSGRVTELKGVFPLARYLNAFDAVVSAAGYNAVHEYLPAGLPTLLVPNRLTRTDDQVGRAEHLARRGLALTVGDDSAEELTAGVERLLDETTRAELRSALAGVDAKVMTGGAGQTADALMLLAETHEPRRLSVAQRALRARDGSKEWLKRALGPAGTNRIRRLLGRPSVGGTERLEVVIGANPSLSDLRRLDFATNPTVEQLLTDDVVEHVLPGASAGYRSARELLVDRHYDVISQN